ncbi:hypothetical protein [Streptomyces peucetius]|uniref:DUF2812 domain-containing protein n=1 Tax=Streptomyces peucetius TaxID=1950 RepID=A0ABY6IEJ0_STRPE|nr:hypothetical protein [Streptomyces peucetius]UYQ64590.1 hypothetical protein OGH68_26105 [Streptomyces peucetius]
MTTDHTGYFEELAAALRAAHVPEDRAAATVVDLTAYLAETGTTPEEEFGPAADFAAALGGTAPEAAGPPEAAETWTWTADVYNDRRLLSAHGDQGWEVERLDALGRFVCRRPRGTALRWEYRREIVGGKQRDEVLGRLVPEGWEPCGEWFFYAYFKRPRAASAGPTATLDALPARPARSWYIGVKGWIASVGWLTVTAVILTAYYSHNLDFAVAFPVLLAGTFGMTYWVRRTVAKSCGDTA